MNKQTETIQLKVSYEFKKKVEEMANKYGLKVSPYLKMLVTRDIRESERSE